MRGSIRRTAKEFVSNQNYYVEKVFDFSEAFEIVEMLRPRPTQTNLIRLGGDKDGGYLVPDDLEGIDGCFSPGVSTIATFEESLVKSYGIPCYLADYSVEAAPIEHELVEFERKFIGTRNDDVFMRLPDWIATKEQQKTFQDLILQIDIEGSEFEVIADTPSDVLERFRIIIIELHHLNAILTKAGAVLMKAMLAKLTANHVSVHLHPNNCSGVHAVGKFEVPEVMELTLIRKDHFEPADHTLNYPHPLDQPNTFEKEDIILPKCWR